MPICIQTYHTEGAFPLSPLKTFQTSRTPSENRSQKQVLSALLYKKWLRRAWCSHMIIKRPFPGSAVVGNTLKVFLLMSLPSNSFSNRSLDCPKTDFKCKCRVLSFLHHSSWSIKYLIQSPQYLIRDK